MRRQYVPLRRVVRTTVRIAGPASTWRRLREGLPVVAQCGLAAGVAWWFASALLGHQKPVFAATAAIICLAGGKGERARQALDLLAGVIVGVVVGELIRWWNPGSALLQAVLAVVLGMSAAAALDSRRLAYVQGAASALFVLVLPPLQNPASRVIDAAIGGILGLLGSQIFFTPDPVVMVSDAARRVLDSVETALRSSAEGLEKNDVSLTHKAIDRAREARSDLSALAEQRVIADRIRTRTLRGLRRAARLRHLEQRLDHLDMLVAAVLLLTYAAAQSPHSHKEGKVEGTHDGLSGFLHAAANDTGTLIEVLEERSRGKHPEAQLHASVPQTISDSEAVLAHTATEALAALVASEPQIV